MIIIRNEWINIRRCVYRLSSSSSAACYSSKLEENITRWCDDLACGVWPNRTTLPTWHFKICSLKYSEHVVNTISARRRIYKRICFPCIILQISLAIHCQFLLVNSWLFVTDLHWRFLLFEMRKTELRTEQDSSTNCGTNAADARGQNFQQANMYIEILLTVFLGGCVRNDRGQG